MKLFLDASVLLAASGSTTGAANALFSYAAKQGWTLMCSPYAVSEVLRNLPKLPPSALAQWLRLRPQLSLVEDVISLDRPVVFTAGKDRPILLTALAWADVLLTLDKQDFSDLIGETFYGLRIFLPYDFLQNERTAGRLEVK